MQSKEFSINSTIDQISNYAPVVIFSMILIMLGLTGWMQCQFLGGVLTALDAGYLIFLFPIVMQVLRFVTGFLSASFFKKGSWIYGVIVFGFSVWLSVYEYGEVDKMAAYWTNLDISTRPLNHSEETLSITRDSIVGIMTILIWGALVLEFFLAAWLGSLTKVEVYEAEQIDPAPVRQEQIAPSTPQQYLSIDETEIDRYIKKAIEKDRKQQKKAQEVKTESETTENENKLLLAEQIKQVLLDLNQAPKETVAPTVVEPQPSELEADLNSFSTNGKGGTGSTTLS